MTFQINNFNTSERQKIIDAVQTNTFDGLFALYHLLLDKEKSQHGFLKIPDGESNAWGL